jgi:hypothetical protein
MLPRHITASILSLAVCAMPLAAACDDRPSTEHILATIANDCHDERDDLAAEVDRLQAENDALRAAARLSVVAPIDAPALRAVTPREQGKPWQKYLPTAETQDTIAAIMKACGAKPITISSSGYDPDATTADDQVLSLAYSYMGGAKARACLDAEMDKRGAVSL